MTDIFEFKNKINIEKNHEGAFTWNSPSNIALIKYWGKKEIQIPKNSSLSFTLSKCSTNCNLRFKLSKSIKEFKFQLFFEGKREISFETKMNTFFQRINRYCSYLNNAELVIETSNSFPHSSGIASSASAYSALSLCLMEIEKSFSPDISSEFFFKKASFLSRLGSGSACRSTLGPVVIWGENTVFNDSSNYYGTKYPKGLHDIFKNYNDTILLVDKGKKHVSSSVGHDLMNDHFFSNNRLSQAENNIIQLCDVLTNGDIDQFIKIVESEALTLHAMMMTSNPYFILLKPNTLKIINEVWNYRKTSGSKVCFTLDAGANIHLLYPNNEFDKIQNFIKKSLSVFCTNGEFINDQVGYGPNKL